MGIINRTKPLIEGTTKTNVKKLSGKGRQAPPPPPIKKRHVPIVDTNTYIEIYEAPDKQEDIKNRPTCPPSKPEGGIGETMSWVMAVLITITIVGMIVILNIIKWGL